MATILGVVLNVHSLLRWVIAIVALVAVVRFGYGWLTKQSFQKLDRGLMSGLAGMVDTQLLVGIILLVGLGFSSRERWEHAFTMVLVAVLGHLPLRWKNASDTNKFRNNFITVVVMTLLVIAGVWTIRPGLGIWTQLF